MAKSKRKNTRAAKAARRTGAKGTAKGAKTPRKAAKPAARAWPTGPVSLTVVARRADADPRFFRAIAASPDAVNEALARFKMQLSEEDARRLRDALAKIEALRIELSKVYPFRGWGPWPYHWPFKPHHEPPLHQGLDLDQGRRPTGRLTE